MSDQPDLSAAPEPPAIPDDLMKLRAELKERTRQMEERVVRRRIAHQLRAAADDDPDGVDPLAAHIWAHCHRDDQTGATWDDPRRIAAAAYQWLADHLDEETP